MQKLGAKRFTSFSDNVKSARESNLAYAIVRDSELAKREWTFSLARVQLAPDTATPAFDYSYQFTLPGDCLRPLKERDTVSWYVEGRKLLTNDGDTLNLRYIARVTDPNLFDPTFTEAMSTRLALELCEAITQSNTKKRMLEDRYVNDIFEARRANAFTKLADNPPESSWISGRR